MATELRLHCFCGKAELRLSGEPSGAGTCHCADCRDFYAVPLFRAAIWQAAQILGADHVAKLEHPAKRMSRFFCSGCGETLYGINRLDLRVVPLALIARQHNGELPPSWQPRMHLFYSQRVIDVFDALPKFLQGWDGPQYVAPSA